jgi:hypothetical protein
MQARKVETEAILRQFQAFQSEKNAKILHLEAQLSRRVHRSTRIMAPPALTVASPGTTSDESEWSSSSSSLEQNDPHVIPAGAINKEGVCHSSSYLDLVETLKMDLLTSTAKHKVSELVETASCRPWQRDVHIERFCKSVESRVNKLVDMAIQRYMWCEADELSKVKRSSMHGDASSPSSHVVEVTTTVRLPCSGSPTSSLDDDSSQET